MSLLLRLQRIPVIDLAVMLAAAAVLLYVVALGARARKRRAAGREDSAQPGARGQRAWRAVRYVVRLAGFALAALIVVGGSVLILEDYRYTVRYTAPTPSEVEILDDLPFEVEEVTFEGGDGLRLAGWFVPPRNGATIILLHGYGGNRTGTVWYAIPLVEAGYGVLMYDERASGESEGTMRSYGWQDVPDVGGALAYLSSRPDVDPDRIGIAGCSIGGQIALRGAAAYPQIRAALADGPSSVTAADDPPPHNWATALSTLSGFVIDRMFEARLGMQAPPPMIETIGLIAPRPILLIAGGTPHPYYGSEAAHVECFYQHAGDNAELWVIPEAYHCDGLAARPQEYVNRMIAFFDAAVD